MASLKDFSTLDISWDLTPEHAVTMYLEWGNNDWHSEYPPVRSKDDMSNYFVVDTWGREPVIRLVQRNSEHVEGHQRSAGAGQGMAQAPGARLVRHTGQKRTTAFTPYP